jgi:hypothetical protein
MSIYMLNLIFDPGDNTEGTNGGFKENNNTKPALQQSKVWLTAQNSDPQPDDPTAWANPVLTTAGALKLVLNDGVWVRILGLNMLNFVAQVTTTVCRNSGRASQNPVTKKPYQERRSPFALTTAAGPTDQSCVLYVTNGYVAQSTAAGSWAQYLGPVVFRTELTPKPPELDHDAYSAIVAIAAGAGTPGNPPADPYMYSHDPEMDVQC